MSIEIGLLFHFSQQFFSEKDYLSFILNSGDLANVQAP